MVPTARRINLDQLKVESPCPASWDSMTGDARSRHCDHCDLHVHNLSAMTRDEAQQLICNAAGRLCIAYVPSAQGNVTTLEYHRQTKPRYRWRWVAVLAAAGAVTSTVAASILHPWRRPVAVNPMVMGGIKPSAMVLGDIAAPSTQPSQAQDLGNSATDDSVEALDCWRD